MVANLICVNSNNAARALELSQYHQTQFVFNNPLMHI